MASGRVESPRARASLQVSLSRTATDCRRQLSPAEAQQWRSPRVGELPARPFGRLARFRVPPATGPQIRRGDPLNLSISISGGKATNQDSPSNGERSGNSSSRQSLVSIASELWPAEADAPDATPSKLTWKGTSERVIAPCVAESPTAATVFGESGCLGVQPKVGGKLHLKPNNGTRPIANKYREGKVKSTLERELKRPRNRWEGNACSRTGPRRVQGAALRPCRRGHPLRVRVGRRRRAPLHSRRQGPAKRGGLRAKSTRRAGSAAVSGGGELTAGGAERSEPAEERGGTSTRAAQVRLGGPGRSRPFGEPTSSLHAVSGRARPSGREVVPRLALRQLGQPSAAFDPS